MLAGLVLATVSVTSSGAVTASEHARQASPARKPAQASADAVNPPADLQPLERFDPPDQPIDVDLERSPALDPIEPLGPVPVPGDRVEVEREPLPIDPPVRPSRLQLPLRSGQELVDAETVRGLAELDSTGFLGDGGAPALDAAKLQPQVSSAQFGDPNDLPPLSEIIEAILSGQIPPPLPVDPLALLEELPQGIPRLTYRMCMESAGKDVSCTITVPLIVPTVLDVTGDGTSDVLAMLLPAVSPGGILDAVGELTDLEESLDSATTRLEEVLELLEDPINLILHPELLLERLHLESLIEDLTADIAELVEDLNVTILRGGLALLVQRLPTSELSGQPLPAHVWAAYNLPNGQRLSVGYDGFRRGDSLSTTTLGIFTMPLVDLVGGRGDVFDVRGELLNAGGGDSLALTMGLSSVTDDAGEPYDPTVASARFSPVPNVFDAQAVVDLDKEEGTVKSSSNIETLLDAIVVTNRNSDGEQFDRYTRLVVDQLPTRVSASLTRPPDGGAATLDYEAASTIDRVAFTDLEYADGDLLDRSMRAEARDLPARFTATVDRTQPDVIDFDYTASSRMTSLDAGVYDRDPAIVGTATLQGIPSEVSLHADLPGDHVTFAGNQPLGSGEAVFSRNLGSFAPRDGDHTTFVTDDEAVGISARVTGLRAVDAYFGQHPRLSTTFDPGGQPFIAAGDLDGVWKARAEISNLPEELSVDLNPPERTLAYRANTVVDRVFAATTNTESGPTVFATIVDLPARVDASWQEGDRPQVVYDASSEISRIELFASPDHVEALRPTGEQYLSVAVDDVPTALDVLVDFPARHLEGNMASDVGRIAAVARFPFDGRNWSATADLHGVPARFDGDFVEGSWRLRGISGPFRSASVGVTNHNGTTRVVGPGASMHYREETGDLDASASVRELRHVEYTQDSAGDSQTLRLDVADERLAVDVNVVLAAGGVDDSRLAVFGHVDNLPGVMTVALTDGSITYTADRAVALDLEARIGKVAALDGLEAPRFAHGVAVAARGCPQGAGCAADDSPACTVFARCAGAVGTIVTPGLPPSIDVDLNARTVRLEGWEPPSSPPFSAYVRLEGLVAGVPWLEVLAALDGMSSPLDVTVGPITLEGSGNIDVAYSASGPVGSLSVAAETRADGALGTLRATASVSPLPQSLHVVGTFGEQSRLSYEASAPIDRVTATVTGVDVGYLDAVLTDVPARIDAVVDMAARHADVDMSDALGGIEVHLRTPRPVAGDTWWAFFEAADVPGRFEADFRPDLWQLRTLSGPLGLAAFAATNHEAAQVPVGNHLAAHWWEARDDIDFSARLRNITSGRYAGDRSTGTQTVTVVADSGRVAFDAAVNFAADHGGQLHDDLRLAGRGAVTTPNEFEIAFDDQGVTWDATEPTDLQAQAWVGKVDALDRDTPLGVPLPEQGVAMRARSCGGEEATPGCAADDSLACTIFDRCAGAVATVNMQGLPERVTANLAKQTVSIEGYRPPPSAPLDVFVGLDDLVSRASTLQARAVLSGLPSPLDLDVGPFNFSEDDPTDFRVGYSSSIDAPDATLTVDALARGLDFSGLDGVFAPVDELRGRAELSPVPAQIGVSAEFGSTSTVKVDPGTSIDELKTQVTAVLPDGTTPSALVDFDEIPDEMTFSLQGTRRGYTLPPLSYSASASTLDGLAQIEPGILAAFNFDETTLTLTDDVWARLTDLGAEVSFDVHEEPAPPDPPSDGDDDAETCFSDGGGGGPGNVDVATLTSNPATGALQLGGGVQVDDPMPTMPFECDEDSPLFKHDPTGPGDYEGRLTGSIAANQLTLSGFGVGLTDISELNVRESPTSSWLTPGIEGAYGSLAIEIGEFGLDVDIELLLEIEAGYAIASGKVTADIDVHDTLDQVRFRLSDQYSEESEDGYPLPSRHSECIATIIDAAGLPPFLFYLQPQTLPGPIGTGVNEIEIPSGDGKYTLSLLPDLTAYINPQTEGDFQILNTPDWTLLTIDVLNGYAFGPFEKGVTWDWGLTGCPGS